jgi:integrase/recombinase XerC/integrase/recombinase XerD
LLDAAATSQFPERETALIMFLVDTGVRASECVSILIRDVDKTGKSVIVTGKGNKQRTVRFGRETSMAIWRYLRSREDGGDGEAPLFVSHAGNTSGSKLCRDALGDIIQRMGKAAGIIGVRCSPHTLRHTFAIQFLRNGGNSFALQGLLGHTDMKQTAGYVRIANLNLAEQHVLASPMDNLRRK